MVRELFRVLIQESVAGVGVDPQLRVRQVPGEEAAVSGSGVWSRNTPWGYVVPNRSRRVLIPSTPVRGTS